MSTSPEASSPFTALIVDSLAFRVVVDSHYERFIPQASHASVAIEHAGEIPGRQMSALAGEYGGFRCIWNRCARGPARNTFWISAIRPRC